MTVWSWDGIKRQYCQSRHEMVSRGRIGSHVTAMKRPCDGECQKREEAFSSPRRGCDSLILVPDREVCLSKHVAGRYKVIMVETHRNKIAQKVREIESGRGRERDRERQDRQTERQRDRDWQKQR